jgi:hypothetical protein
MKLNETQLITQKLMIKILIINYFYSDLKSKV